MSEIIYGDIKQLIGDLAQSLGVAGEYVFEAFIRQQMLSGISSLITWIIILLISVFIVIFTLIAYFKAEHDDSWLTKGTKSIYRKSMELGEGAIWVVFGIALLFILIAVFVIPEEVARIINPEYYAVDELIKLLGG